MTIDSAMRKQLFQHIIDKRQKNSDLDWSEIRDMFGLDCTPDHLRKMAAGVELFEDIIKMGFDSTSVSFAPTLEIDSKIDEFQKERYKLLDQRRLKNNDLRYEARFEQLREDMIRAIRELEGTKPLQWDVPVPLHENGKEAIINWNDWHVGLEAKNHWNTFNDDVLRDRVTQVVKKNIEHGKRHNVNTVHVFCNGDFLNGIIHITSRINATMDAVEQTKVASELLSECVAQLANNFSKVKMYFAKGNHDRTSPQKKDELAKESFYEFIPWFVKERIRNVNNVEFIENEYDHEIIVADVSGHKIIGVHGHRDNPSNVVQNLSLMLGFKPYAVYMAHRHTYGVKEVHGVYVFTSPSLCGVDTYAKEQRMTGQAGQLMSIFDDAGEFCTYNIKFN